MAANDQKYRAWITQFEQAFISGNSNKLQQFFLDEAEALEVANMYKHLIPEEAREYLPIIAKQINQKSDSSYQVIKNQYQNRVRKIEFIGAEEKEENGQMFVLLSVRFVTATSSPKQRFAVILLNNELNILEIQ